MLSAPPKTTAVYRISLRGVTHPFSDLRWLLAKASPARSGDARAEVPLAQFLAEPGVPYETDEATRLILDANDRSGFPAG